MTNPMIRVVLVDDHPALRMGLRIMLEQAPDIQVVAEAGSGAEALACIEALRPEVVVLDCQLPGISGMEVAAQVRRLALPVHILALSAYSDDQVVQSMIQAGALGYVLKDEAPAVIVAAVRAWAVRPPPAADLTERERDVLRLLGRGWDNQRIGAELHISERTVRFHLRNIYDKIGAHTRAEAVVWAVNHKL